MSPDPLTLEAGELGWLLVDAALAVLAVVLVVRIIGLRSFAKMSSFDFAVTVACGSILASVLLDPDRSFVHALVAVGALLAVQWCIARGRRASPKFQELMDNEPLLLMANGRVIEENMATGRITHEDLRAKLREANALRPEKVHAVVLETTGDVSVLHGDDAPDPNLLRGVRGWEG